MTQARHGTTCWTRWLCRCWRGQRVADAPGTDGASRPTCCAPATNRVVATRAPATPAVLSSCSRASAGRGTWSASRAGANCAVCDVNRASTLASTSTSTGSTRTLNVSNGKAKGRVLAIAPYMSRTRDQKRFTISEVAADWHELMIPQRTMRPSIARVSEQLDPRFAASGHTTAPISHTRPSPRTP